jgi:transcriptional regulator with XRE-family HTH domain
MNAVQCKMARAAVGIGVRELAAVAKVSPDTVARLERGEPLRERTVDAIRAALESAGVEFTNGDQPGVRLKMFKLKDGGKNAFPMDPTNSKFFGFGASAEGKSVTTWVEDFALDSLKNDIHGSAEYLSTLEANRARLFRIAQTKYERGVIERDGSVMVNLKDLENDEGR